MWSVSAVNSRWVATVAALLMTGCMAAQPEPARISVVEQGAHCGASSAGIAWERADEGWRVRVSMGQHATGGYALELADPEVRKRDGAWELQLYWREPGPDELVTQALTAPCLVLAVPWDIPVPLRVLDQQGRERMAVEPEDGASAQ